MTGVEIFLLCAIGVTFGFSLINYLYNVGSEREFDEIFGRLSDLEHPAPAPAKTKVTPIKKKR